MKYRVSSLAICPHYRHETSQMIYCDGMSDGQVIHNAFANKTDAKEWKKDYCKGKYANCAICRMVEGNNDDR